MKKVHHVIYVPGLRDQRIINRFVTWIMPLFWEKDGQFKLHIISPKWERGGSFEAKLKSITDQIDKLAKLGEPISLLGQSAGGSAVMNAYCLRKKLITAVVNSTGRLKAGADVHPTLNKAAKISPAFKQSVLLFEIKNQPNLSPADRKKVLTLRPIWDETVPSSTVPLVGAKNITVPMIEHSLSGIFIVTFYSHLIKKFLKSLD